MNLRDVMLIQIVFLTLIWKHLFVSLVLSFLLDLMHKQSMNQIMQFEFPSYGHTSISLKIIQGDYWDFIIAEIVDKFTMKNCLCLNFRFSFTGKDSKAFELPVPSMDAQKCQLKNKILHCTNQLKLLFSRLEFNCSWSLKEYQRSQILYLPQLLYSFLYEFKLFEYEFLC